MHFEERPMYHEKKYLSNLKNESSEHFSQRNFMLFDQNLMKLAHKGPIDNWS